MRKILGVYILTVEEKIKLDNEVKEIMRLYPPSFENMLAISSMRVKSRPEEFKEKMEFEFERDHAELLGELMQKEVQLSKRLNDLKNRKKRISRSIRRIDKKLIGIKNENSLSKSKRNHRKQASKVRKRR